MLAFHLHRSEIRWLSILFAFWRFRRLSDRLGNLVMMSTNLLQNIRILSAIQGIIRADTNLVHQILELLADTNCLGRIDVIFRLGSNGFRDSQQGAENALRK